MHEPDAKDKILLAAKHEFASKGFAGARMSGIAERAGVNKAMLHYYFNSKENLYSHTLQKLFNINLEANQVDFENIINRPLSLWEKLYSSIYIMINAQIKFIDSDFHQIMAWEMAEGRKHFTKFAKKFLIPRLKTMESLVKEGVNQGIFATENSFIFVIDILSLVLFYTINRPFYAETDLYDNLYGKDPQQTLINFIMNHFSKALAPKMSDNENFNVSQQLTENLENLLKKTQIKGASS